MIIVLIQDFTNRYIPRTPLFYAFGYCCIRLSVKEVLYNARKLYGGGRTSRGAELPISIPSHRSEVWFITSLTKKLGAAEIFHVLVEFDTIN